MTCDACGNSVIAGLCADGCRTEGEAEAEARGYARGLREAVQMAFKMKNLEHLCMMRDEALAAQAEKGSGK